MMLLPMPVAHWQEFRILSAMRILALSHRRRYTLVCSRTTATIFFTTSCLGSCCLWRRGYIAWSERNGRAIPKCRRSCGVGSILTLPMRSGCFVIFRVSQQSTALLVQRIVMLMTHHLYCSRSQARAGHRSHRSPAVRTKSFQGWMDGAFSRCTHSESMVRLGAAGCWPGQRARIRDNGGR